MRSDRLLQFIRVGILTIKKFIQITYKNNYINTRTISDTFKQVLKRCLCIRTFRNLSNGKVALEFQCSLNFELVRAILIIT